MARSKTQQTTRSAELSQLKAEYRHMAKVANQRMSRLETLAEKPEYAAVLGYAYKNAAYDIINVFDGDPDKPRFLSISDIEKMAGKKIDITTLKMYTARIEDFLESPSSTKSGIIKVYKKRADTLNSRYGTNFTFEDMQTFFNSNAFKKFSFKFGSKTLMKMIGKIQENAEEIIKSIDESRKAHKRIDIDALKDVDGLDTNAMLSGSDKSEVYNIAKIYAEK